MPNRPPTLLPPTHLLHLAQLRLQRSGLQARQQDAQLRVGRAFVDHAWQGSHTVGGGAWHMRNAPLAVHARASPALARLAAPARTCERRLLGCAGLGGAVRQHHLHSKSSSGGAAGRRGRRSTAGDSQGAGQQAAPRQAAPREPGSALGQAGKRWRARTISSQPSRPLMPDSAEFSFSFLHSAS